MANVLPFHHALGMTPGMDALADLLRDAGHTVTAPDLYDGRTFSMLVSACVPPGTYSGSWPAGVPLQVHAMEQDPLFVEEGDLDAAVNLVESAQSAELILYPGNSHFFADISSPEYNEDAAHALTASILQLLAGVEG